MRFRASLTVLLAVLTAACTEETGFTVHGTATPGPDGAGVVRLYRDGVLIDSCAVSGGKFSFSGQQDVTSLLYAVADLPSGSSGAAFIPDAENIYIDLDYPATVTGSPLTDSYLQFESDVHSLLAAEGWKEDLGQLCRSTYLEHQGDALGHYALTLLQTHCDNE